MVLHASPLISMVWAASQTSGGLKIGRFLLPVDPSFFDLETTDLASLSCQKYLWMRGSPLKNKILPKTEWYIEPVSISGVFWAPQAALPAASQPWGLPPGIHPQPCRGPNPSPWAGSLNDFQMEMFRSLVSPESTMNRFLLRPKTLVFPASSCSLHGYFKGSRHSRSPNSSSLWQGQHQGPAVISAAEIRLRLPWEKTWEKTTEVRRIWGLGSQGSQKTYGKVQVPSIFTMWVGGSNRIHVDPYPCLWSCPACETWCLSSFADASNKGTCTKPASETHRKHHRYRRKYPWSE